MRERAGLVPEISLNGLEILPWTSGWILAVRLASSSIACCIFHIMSIPFNCSDTALRVTEAMIDPKVNFFCISPCLLCFSNIAPELFPRIFGLFSSWYLIWSQGETGQPGQPSSCEEALRLNEMHEVRKLLWIQKNQCWWKNGSFRQSEVEQKFWTFPKSRVLFLIVHQSINSDTINLWIDFALLHRAELLVKPACILLLVVTVTFFTCPDVLPLQNQLYPSPQSKNHIAITHISEQTCGRA